MTERHLVERAVTERDLVRRPVAAAPLPAGSLLRAVPGLARVAATSAWQATAWSMHAGRVSTNYVAQRVIDGQTPAAILQDAATDLRNGALRLLGLPVQGPYLRPAERAPRPVASTSDLQRRGSELIRRSNDVHVVEDTHPAFARILSEITPDEARILRYLYLDGPQPAIDVRTNRPLGIGSVLVAGGLNMIAEHSGCVHLERIHPYLTNLARLGLISFSKEQVSNPKRYQVVEAQPKVAAALKRAGRMPRMVQRSILLTTFGEEFCRTCLPLGGATRTTRLDPADGRGM
ncbi:MAG: DUF4393 domain-containing protein [Jatrophihabitans sp.]|nr:MAG: DUF4393 domain-containing protein [Jatrophihabitans sp.]